MDSGSVALAAVAASNAKAQQAVAARLMKMNANADAAVANLLQASQDNLAKLAQAANPPGVGGNLDVSA
ncbi:MAG: putative motility protein [Rhizobiales bacterium]|nr:putative motility protein [Hyphomicrobiales bacterium]